MKFDLETIKAILKLAIDSAKVFLAAGVIIVFFYCFAEGFSITGLSISDVFLFTFVAFSFGAIYGIGVLFGTVAAIWFVNLLAWLQNTRKNRKHEVILRPAIKGLFMSGFSFAFFLLMVAAGFFLKFDPAVKYYSDYWSAIAYFVAVGIVTCLMFGITFTVADKGPTRRQAVYAVALVALCYLSILHPKLLNLTLGQMGIRSKPSDVVLLDNENYQKTISIAKLHNIPMKSCQVPGQSIWVIENLNVVWNAFGDKSYIEIYQVDLNTEAFRNFKQFFVSKTGIEMIRGGRENWSCKFTEVK